MEKKKKRAPEKKLTRTTVIALVVIVLASVAHLGLVWQMPLFPQYWRRDILYPVMRFWWTIEISIILIIIWTYLELAKNLPRRTSTILMLGLLALINCYSINFNKTLYRYVEQQVFTQQDSIRFNEHVYYLVAYRPADPLYYDSGSYGVYECDSLGIICHSIAKPEPAPRYSYSIEEIQTLSPTKFTLSNDQSELYVLIGEEEFLVATQSP